MRSRQNGTSSCQNGMNDKRPTASSFPVVEAALGGAQLLRTGLRSCQIGSTCGVGSRAMQHYLCLLVHL